MADTESELANCVGAVYEAAASDANWCDVGERLCRLLDARRAMLLLEDQSGRARNVLMQADTGEADYVAHFRSLNPYVEQAGRDFASARHHHLGRAKLGAEIVPETIFLRSEYYADYARRHERRHMIGGVLGVSAVTPIGFFRGDDSGAFGERQVRLLESILPHVQRALELRARLFRDRENGALTRAALDSLSVGVVIVDADLKIRFANRSARVKLAVPGAAVICLRSGPRPGTDVYLSAHSRNTAAALKRLVASAALGGPGGWLRAADCNGSVAAALVSAMPPSLAGGTTGDPIAERMAIITIQPVRPTISPPADMLCDFFGLSRAESEVALALAGGATANDVARQRRVSLGTVRTQIRAILRKSESENLRDLERSLAMLAALLPSSSTLAAE